MPPAIVKFFSDAHSGYAYTQSGIGTREENHSVSRSVKYCTEAAGCETFSASPASLYRAAVIYV